MARRTRKRRKGGWLRTVGLFILSLVVVWASAFVVWIYWAEIESFVKSRWTPISRQESQKPSQEKILEEDRQKLEEILKERK